MLNLSLLKDQEPKKSIACSFDSQNLADKPVGLMAATPTEISFAYKDLMLVKLKIKKSTKMPR